ncbi:MAG: DUF4295 domain-containing protein [Bacteroidales bacterium]|jgi:hypothetical protein|nr:DUF4295 domain-containing protein [Bacteroidales bacterium]MBQ5539211.1 DUF4295 domain-containing protein [Bacteroidales bacterium]MEE3447858.1 DUF4295 domain-containing protein [Bacteroidales bacterium]
MAKKVVATLKKEDSAANALTRIVKAVRSPKTGAYCFKELIVPQTEAKEALKDLK